MSTDELRTAAIEAIRPDIADLLGDDCTEFGLVSWTEGIVDAVLPLLVAGTASRIADAIGECCDHIVPLGYDQKFCPDCGTCADIAHRVGETS